MKSIRIALDGCYPSFWDTDLIIRILRSICCTTLVPITSSHDLLISGPFSNGSRKRRVIKQIINFANQVRSPYYCPIKLHVSSENHAEPNYQSFEQSECDYGIGHEIIDAKSYLRCPHWMNYLDFAGLGIPSPANWPRLGAPIQCNELYSPIRWNNDAYSRAAFVTSNLTSIRKQLLHYVSQCISVDGFGKAFNPRIKNHNSSGFSKRALLKHYKYCFCPENSISPGYYTEKIPESYISGAIPIAYCDRTVNIDFAASSFLNLNDFIHSNEFNKQAFCDAINSNTLLNTQLETPLINYDLSQKAENLRTFLQQIVALSVS